jgi:hypothetical protein
MDMSDTVAPSAPLDDLFAPSPAAAVRAFAWSPRAKSLTGLHGWLRAFLYIFIVTQIALLFIAGSLMWVFYTWSNEGGLDDLRAAILGMASGSIAQLLPYISIGTFVFCLLFYLWFVFRTSRNLHLSNARGLAISPGWAIGWNFVPVVNLGMTYAVMAELWRVSRDPERGRFDPPSSLAWWWGMWLGGGVLARISDMLVPSDPGDDPTLYFSALLPGLVVSIIASLLAIASTGCLLRVVRQITQSQEALAKPPAP